MEEFVADAPVEADAAGHALHIGAGGLAEVGDLVDEGDPGGEEGVGGVFGEFGGLPRREKERRVADVERAVKRAEHRARMVALGADDDPVGAHEVFDRRSFAKELGVRRHIETDARPQVGASGGNGALDFRAGADGNRGLQDDHGAPGETGGDLPRCGVDVTQVGMAVAAAARCADGDEDGVGVRHGVEIGANGKTPGADVARHEVLEARFVDGDFAGVQACDLFGVVVHTGDAGAEFREAGPRHQADIAGADDDDLHRAAPRARMARAPSARSGRASATATEASRSPSGVPQSNRSPANR